MSTPVDGRVDGSSIGAGTVVGVKVGIGGWVDVLATAWGIANVTVGAAFWVCAIAVWIWPSVGSLGAHEDTRRIIRSKDIKVFVFRLIEQSG